MTSLKDVHAALGTPQLWLTVQQVVDGAAEWHDEELCTLLELLCDTPNTVAPNALDSHNCNIVVRQLIGKLLHRSKPGNPSRPVQCLQHMLNKVLANKKASLSAKLYVLVEDLSLRIRSEFYFINYRSRSILITSALF